MATVLSTLYPPLVDTFMPAFPNQGDAVVNFTISPYNSSYDIRYLHVTLVNQKTNKNAFTLNNSSDSVPAGTALLNGVWIIPFDETLDNQANPYLDMDRNSNYYSLTIPRSILKPNESNKREFVVDCYYKVQLRFDKYIDSVSGATTITSWNTDYLVEKRAFFSEWSSVTLLKAIPTISVHLNNFTMELDDYLKSNPANSITNIMRPGFTVPVRKPQYMPGIIPFAGNLTFEGENDSGIDKTARTEYYNRDIRTTSNSEYLMSYQIKIYDELGEKVKDSGMQYTAKAEKTNNFYWLCDLTKGEVNKTYSVELTFTTNNQYTFSKTFNFVLIPPNEKVGFNPTFVFEKMELPYNGLGYAWKRSDDPYFSNMSSIELAKLNSEVRSDGIWYEVDSEKVLVTCEDGWVTLTINQKELISPGYLFIKRATSLDNFKTWQLIDCSYVQESASFSRTITDKTVSSLVSYKYSAQYLTAKGSWTPTYTSPEVVYPDFHDILLSRGDRQLAIRYNAQIASMTPVVNRVKIDTLGGRYPKFAENAKLHYRQFQLSGLIIAESDYNRKFLDDLNYTSEMAIYDERMGGKYGVRNDTVKETGSVVVEYEDDKGETKSQTMYDGTYSLDISSSDTAIKKQKRDTQKNTYHDIYPMNNWWWEREFREQAIEWLNDGEPKLYRSMTEGNLIVMLDGISLTPNAQLGRRIWNFSCTVYQVGDGNSLDELDALGVYSVENSYEADFSSSSAQETSANTTISREQLGQTFHITAREGNPTTVVAAELQPDQGPTVGVVNDDGEFIFPVAVPSIEENILSLYQGLYENYQFNSTTITLRDVKIQFESLPQWYDLNSLTPSDTLPGTLYFTVERDNQIVDVKLVFNEGQWEVADATEIISGTTWGNADMSISDFFSDWENNLPNPPIATGNDLFKINLDSGDSIYVDPKQGPAAIDHIIDACVNEQGSKNNYGLGYKLKLTLVSPYDSKSQLVRTIFVNEKGYYQVPSNMVVKEITLYDGATATIDYILNYDLRYDDETEPNAYEATENIVGQVSGEWDWGTAIDPIISAKYWAYDKEDNGAVTQQMVDSWSAVSFDGTPYTILNIQSTQDIASEKYIVGRSGVLNLQTDYPTKSICINGKRMIQAPISRQKYLDEWEYVIDGSVYEAIEQVPAEEAGGQFWYVVYNNTGANISDWIESDELGEGVPVIVYLSDGVWDEDTARKVIDGWYKLGSTTNIDRVESLQPEPNTIYAVANTERGYDYKIYYLDQGWFNVEFPNIQDKDLSIAYARVPVYGMIDYRATITKKLWDPPTVKY